ncbi:spermidine synthase [compost metagenome]|jgi:spermidine synthase
MAVMAFKQPPSLTGWDALAKKADELEGRFGLEFGEFVKRLKEANLHSNNRLLI